MRTGTAFAIAVIFALLPGCGGSNPMSDSGLPGDTASDYIIGSDLNGLDVRLDTISQDGSGPDGLESDSSRDQGLPPEPCRPGESCDDHDPCTIDDLCDDNEECAGTPVEDCDDGIECTFDECTSDTECTHDLKPGWCFVAGKCIEDGDSDPAVICRSCQTALKNDELLPDDNMSCDDGDTCTVNDRCHEGFCIADARDCGDRNSCTADMCVDGSCVNEPVEGMCNDEDLCTENDLCVDGQCVGSPIGCWDQNPCTQDACHPDFGCVHEFLNIPCDDGNICSVGDRCWLGTCLSGDGMKDCDDDNQCTDDGCVPVREDGCVHIPNTAPCDDGDPCTLEDKCKAGSCDPGKGVLDCDDGNPCTTDSCLKGIGCVYENNTLPCDDDDPCTLDDVCGGGVCKAGETLLECNDGNECTTDFCEPGIGCAYENNLNICDDDNVCTNTSTCMDGVCIGESGVDCSDDDSCTLDYCLPTGNAPGCYHKPLPECRPQIVIDYPPRASTISKKTGDQIVVRGHIEYPPNAIQEDGYPSPEMAMSKVVVNGLDVWVDPRTKPWSFQSTMTLQQGMNPIVAYGQANAVPAYKDYVVQSLYYSDTWFPVSHANPTAGMVSDGVKIFLGKTVWDDNNTATADDIATLLTNILKTLSLSTLIKNPVTSGEFGWCKYKVNLKNMKYGTPSIDLIPDWGKIKVKVVIPRFSVDIDVPISGFACPDFSGDASATSITINADLNLAIDSQGRPLASISNPDVVVSGLDVDVDGIWGFLFNWIIDFFEDNFADMIEDEFETQLAGQLSELVRGAVADLALDPEFPVPELLPGMTPVTLQMKSKFSTISITPEGSDIGLAAVVLPDAAQTPPAILLGSIGRGACLGTDPGIPAFPHTYEMGLMAKDDFLNEALYAIWASNGLKIPVGPEMLGDFDLSEFGISNLSLNVDFQLPPLISDCNLEHKMFFQAGDIRVNAGMKLLGSQVDMVMYASLIAEARIVLVPGATGTEVGIQIETPLFIDIEVAQIAGGLVGAEDTISSLIRTVALPMVLDLLSGDTLASFQLPSIDLSSLAEGFPAGSVIEIDMKEVNRSRGATIVLGNVK